MKSRQNPITYENALNRAASLCSRCEQCSPDILKKLTSWGLGPSDSSRVIKRLEELNFLDDRRFARAYAHDKLSFSGWGRRKIIQGLWAKQLHREIIDSALDEIDVEEYDEIAMRVISQKAKSYNEWPLSRGNKVKLVRYGMMRGFEYPLIIDIINHKLRHRS